MGCINLDMTIDGMLSDPMIAAALRADKVDARGFETLLRSAASRLDGTRPARGCSPGAIGMQVRRAVNRMSSSW